MDFKVNSIPDSISDPMVMLTMTGISAPRDVRVGVPLD